MTNTEIIDRIRQLKKEKNVSQAKIAKDNSFPGSTVNYWFKLKVLQIERR